MQIKGLLDEDFVNYKCCSMFIISPTCTFKCEKDCGIKCCQNSSLAHTAVMNVDTKSLVIRYLDNPLSSAVVFGGMEPMDSFDEILEFIQLLRQKSNDTVVIYTGYYKDEVEDKINTLKQFSNIIIKFGRFIPDDKHRFDELLGVELASSNQYAEQIS